MKRNDELEGAGHGLSLRIRHRDRDPVGSIRRIGVRRVRRIALPAVAEVPAVRVWRRASRDARGEIDADPRRALEKSRRGRHREVNGGRGHVHEQVGGLHGRAAGIVHVQPDREVSTRDVDVDGVRRVALAAVAELPIVGVRGHTTRYSAGEGHGEGHGPFGRRCGDLHDERRRRGWRDGSHNDCCGLVPG